MKRMRKETTMSDKKINSAPKIDAELSDKELENAVGGAGLSFICTKCGKTVTPTRSMKCPECGASFTTELGSRMVC